MHNRLLCSNKGKLWEIVERVPLERDQTGRKFTTHVGIDTETKWLRDYDSTHEASDMQSQQGHIFILIRPQVH